MIKNSMKHSNLTEDKHNMETGIIECSKHGNTLRFINGRINCVSCIVEREIKLLGRK